MKTARMNSTDFNRLVKATKDFVDELYRPILSYIHMEFDANTQTVTAVACDGYKLSTEHAKADCDESFSCYVKRDAHIPGGGDVQITLCEELQQLRLESADFSVSYNQLADKYLEWKRVVPTTPPGYSITFNGNLLLDALKAAKASCSKSFKGSLVIEFRDPNEPIVIRTNEDDIKLVLPLRMQKREK